MSNIAINEPLTASDDQGTKRGSFALNLITNIANYSLNVIVGFYFVPYLIRHLGVSAYGLIPLATQITMYMMVLAAVMNVSISRYITIAIEQRKAEEAERTFTTSVVVAVAVSAVCALAGFVLVLNSANVLRVPAGLESDARFLLALVVVAFLVNQAFSPFGVSTFCRNRLDIRNAIEMLGIVVRVGLVVVAFSIAAPSIRYVGWGILAASLVAAVGSVATWRILTPELRITRGGLDWSVLKNMVTTGGWISVNQLGSLLYIGIDLIVVNRMLGPEMGGRYATVAMWSTFLRGAATSISTVFNPTIVFHYAHNDMVELVTYMRRSIKMVGLALALPIGLVSGMARPILHVWVGDDFVHLAPLMTLLTIHLSINLGVYPLFFLQSATDRVKVPALVTCAMGLGNLLLAILLASRWGMFGVAAAGAVMLTAKNLIFTPLYGAHILNLRRQTFFLETIPIILSTFGLSLLSWYVTRLLAVESLAQLVYCAILVTVIYCLFVYRFLLSSEERRLLAAMMPSRGS